MSREHFLTHVMTHFGFHSEHEADASIRAVMAALGRALCAADAKHIADQLPEWLAEHMSKRSAQPVVSFIDDIAAQLAIPAGFAREQAGVVLNALHLELTPDGTKLLDRALTEDIASLAPGRASPEAVVGPRHHLRSSLAEGRPGSRHPLSEARPRSTHPLTEG